MLFSVAVNQIVTRIRAVGYPSTTRVVVVSGVGVLALLFAWRFLFAGYGTLFGWESVSRLIRLGGGVQEIRSELAIVVTLLALGAAAKIRQSDSCSPVLYVVAGIIAVQLIVVLIAVSISPYTLAYGPLKLMYIASMALVPLAYSVIVSSVTHRMGVWVGVLSAGLSLSFVALLSPPGAEWTWEYKSPPSDWWTWAPAVANALNTTDPVSVVCLTMDESGRPQEDSSNYLCGRFSFGLTGTSTNPANLLWMSAHACETDPTVTNRFWDEDFFRSFVVVLQVKDVGKPCGMAGSSPVNPFEFVDWSNVRLVGETGKPTSVPR